jgi:lipopolysaccharide/colanic/teichoic acid biosynthesis glycosyltransferase
LQNEHLRRLVDIVLGAGLLFVFALPFVITVLAVALARRGWPFYFDKARGRGGRSFRLFSFRATLRVPWLQSRRAGRITWFELLPWLFNVLRGDMSLVGPAPLPLAADGGELNAALQIRALVRPGLLDPVVMQDSWGPPSGTLDEVLEFFVGYVEDGAEYVRSRSLYHDMRLLLVAPLWFLQR